MTRAARYALPTIDVRKAAADPRIGKPLLGELKIPAPGGPGAGIMHFVDWGLATARLRNRALISSDRPLTVTFYSNAFVTASHWWEVVITPAAPAVSADIVEDGMFDVGSSSDLEFVGLRYGRDGAAALPCRDGWSAAFGLWSRIAGNAASVTAPKEDYDPRSMDPGRLRAYRLTFWPTHVEVRRDMNGEGTPDILVHDFVLPAALPWSEVFVHLVGAASSAGAFPADDECGNYFGAERFIAWRSVSVSPVKYQRTAAFPRQLERDQDGKHFVERTARLTGWMAFDVRDFEHVVQIDTFPQCPPPNDQFFYQYQPGVACAGNGVGSCSVSVANQRLLLSQKVDLQGLVEASLAYDIRGTGKVRLAVNGNAAGELLGAKTAIADPLSQKSDSGTLWVRRSAKIHPEWLLQQNNAFDLSLEPDVEIDRLELELAY